MIISEITELDETLDSMIGEGFSKYASQFNIEVNYKSFNFIAKEDDEIIGIISGHAYYDEVYVENLIILENLRRKGVGSKLLQTVEDNFRYKGYAFIALTTHEFQARDFYIKNGFKIEYVRENKTEPNLTKYYLRKDF